MCELFNGDVPFSDFEDSTLIMLEKLRGKQPLLMDKSTLESNPLYLDDEKYDPYLKRKIPKTWHLLVSTLTTRPPHKRPTAKMILKVWCISCQGCPLNRRDVYLLKRHDISQYEIWV